ncbi:LPXTG cell wall anchor domain-containing protein [Streptomyces sp. NPDC041068]|uniref:LPXTG cell wall anchor domain-containing protein n=1 Tax=Streptomyces sp. NPDC041068 TaxID=3155130 RepID=UPI003407DA97
MTVTPSSARPGERIKLYTVNPEIDEAATLRSEAFAETVELKSTGKVSFEAHVRIRCDAEPGTYTIHFTEPVLPGEDTKAGKVTVEAGGPVNGPKCSDSDKADGTGDDDGSNATTIGIAAGAVVLAAAVAFFSVRRRRRRT